jgi:hypothetical protein
VAVVDAIDGPFLENGPIGDGTELLPNQQRFVEKRLDEIAAASATLLPDVRDVNVRLNICLRLWSGCLSAAKEMRSVDAAGVPYTVEHRAVAFRMIDEAAKHDPIYAAGVEAAPAFKKNRSERYELEGVPHDSVVRRYL